MMRLYKRSQYLGAEFSCFDFGKIAMRDGLFCGAFPVITSQ
jgi:hypothetical protein